MGVCSPCCNEADNNDIALKHKCNFCDMIKTNPFSKFVDVESDYVYDGTGRNLMEMWESKYFGRCVFDKMRKKEGGSISNYLNKKVHGYDIQYMYGGGYYKIENLPDPENN